MPDLTFAFYLVGEWDSATIVIDLKIPTAKVQQVHLLRTTTQSVHRRFSLKRRAIDFLLRRSVFASSAVDEFFL